MALDVNPKVKLARLFEKTSARGNRYFTGRLGAARVLMFATGEAGDDGSSVWELFVQDVEDKRPERQAAKNSGELPFRPARPSLRQDVEQFHDDSLSDALP